MTLQTDDTVSLGAATPRDCGKPSFGGTQDYRAIPRQLWLEVTHGCNLECAHCYAASSPSSFSRDALSVDDFERVLDEARSDFDHLVILGGEPFSVSRTRHLLRHAASLAYESTTVHSNLYRLEAADIAAIEAADALVDFSFLGHDPDTHDQVTRRPGSFARATENVRRLLAANVRVSASFVDTGLVDTSLKKVQSAARQIGLAQVGFESGRRLGRLGRIEVDPAAELCGNCGDTTLAVASDGTVHPCSLSRFIVVGHVHNSSLREILLSEQLSSACESIRRRATWALSISSHDPSGVLKSQAATVLRTPSARRVFEDGSAGLIAAPAAPEPSPPSGCKPSFQWPKIKIPPKLPNTEIDGLPKPSGDKPEPSPAPEPDPDPDPPPEPAPPGTCKPSKLSPLPGLPPKPPKPGIDFPKPGGNKPKHAPAPEPDPDPDPEPPPAPSPPGGCKPSKTVLGLPPLKAATKLPSSSGD